MTYRKPKCNEPLNQALKHQSNRCVDVNHCSSVSSIKNETQHTHTVGGRTVCIGHSLPSRVQGYLWFCWLHGEGRAGLAEGPSAEQSKSWWKTDGGHMTATTISLGPRLRRPSASSSLTLDLTFAQPWGRKGKRQRDKPVDQSNQYILLHHSTNH